MNVSNGPRPPEHLCAAFNVGRLSNVEVQILGRLLFAGYDRESDAFQASGADSIGDESLILAEQFVAVMQFSIRDLAEADPERGKEILRQLAHSDDAFDNELAACCASAFFTVDFDLAAGSLIRIRDHGESGPSEVAYLIMATAITTPDESLSEHQIAYLRRSDEEYCER
jgi:hypothetical protein